MWISELIWHRFFFSLHIVLKHALLAIHSNANKLGVELFANVSKIENYFIGMQFWICKVDARRYKVTSMRISTAHWAIVWRGKKILNASEIWRNQLSVFHWAAKYYVFHHIRNYVNARAGQRNMVGSVGSIACSLLQAKVIKLFTFEDHEMIYEHKNSFASIPFTCRCQSKCAPASNAAAAAAAQSHDKSSRTFFVIIYFSLLIVWMSGAQFVCRIHLLHFVWYTHLMWTNKYVDRMLGATRRTTEDRKTRKIPKKAAE